MKHFIQLPISHRFANNRCNFSQCSQTNDNAALYENMSNATQCLQCCLVNKLPPNHCCCSDYYYQKCSGKALPLHFSHGRIFLMSVNSAMEGIFTLIADSCVKYQICVWVQPGKTSVKNSQFKRLEIVSMRATFKIVKVSCFERVYLKIP